MKYTSDEIKSKLKDLDGWSLIENSITKEYDLKSFVNAVAFILKIAVEAEKIDHHPDILLHSYKKIKITLTTHNKGGVTDNDFNLAMKIDELQSN